jgi:hypothetical protein
MVRASNQKAEPRFEAEALPQVRHRILWLAVAEGRGHLMRANLMRTLLAPLGIEVDIVTTSTAGIDFLEELGTKGSLLSSHFGVVCDARQNVCRRRTERKTLRYFFDPSRCLADLRWLEERARGAALIVNDSFHPALLLAAFRRPAMAERLVHLHGENMRQAVDNYFGSLNPQAIATRAALRRSYACIEHTLNSGRHSEESHLLPPVIAAPRRTRAQVRNQLGLRSARALAVVYLNPHFRDPELAQAIEDSLARQGFDLYGVCEGFANRPAWRARDPQLAGAIAAADLFLAMPGMATLAQVQAFGVPFIALASRQPEQEANLSFLTTPLVVDIEGDVRVALDAAIARLPRPRSRPDPSLLLQRVHTRWQETLVQLIERNPHRRAHAFTRTRDQ